MKGISIALLLSGLLALSLPVFAHADIGYGESCGGMMGMMGGYGFMGMGWFGMALGVLFWVGVIVLVYYILKKAGLFSASKGETAIEIAKKRFAKGEITGEQLEEIKKAI